MQGAVRASYGQTSRSGRHPAADHARDARFGDLAAQISAKGALALALAGLARMPKSVQAAIETLHLLREMRRPSSHSTLVGLSGVSEVLLRGRRQAYRASTISGANGSDKRSTN